ncbi:MAG: inositol monophosphatase [Caldilineaceae bacterium]|nr:inositol monophosphatase [Caldilineaceae bacterium]
MSGSQVGSGRTVDLSTILPFVLDVAQQAGDLVLAMQAKGLQNVVSKSNPTDLVTEADVASEKLILTALQSRFPDFGFWGEESNQPPTTEYFWVVDPIDGTTNFANGLPYFAVNIALNKGADTLIGVTLELPAGHLYFAQVGQGAYLRTAGGRDIRLHVNDTSSLSRAFLCTGFPYHRTEHEDNNLAEFSYLTTRSQGVRCMGSAALDLVNVARGALAGYWEGWLNPWDAAPGVLIVREAGGQVTEYSGDPWQLTSKSLIATNGQPDLHRALVTSINTARKSLTSTLLPPTEPA